MAWGLLTGLSIYSFLVTGALVLVTVLYANSGTRMIETCKKNNGSGEIKTQQLTHVDLFNVDVSGNSNDNKTGECTTMEILGFKLFETIILTLIFIGLIWACYKLIVNGRHVILKLREKRALEENKRFENLTNLFKDYSLATVHYKFQFSHQNSSQFIDDQLYLSKLV